MCVHVCVYEVRAHACSMFNKMVIVRVSPREPHEYCFQSSNGQFRSPRRTRLFRFDDALAWCLRPLALQRIALVKLLVVAANTRTHWNCGYCDFAQFGGNCHWPLFHFTSCGHADANEEQTVARKLPVSMAHFDKIGHLTNICLFVFSPNLAVNWQKLSYSHTIPFFFLYFQTKRTQLVHPGQTTWIGNLT